MSSEEQSEPSETGTVRARAVFSHLVPDGRAMIEVERPHETVICVRPGEISPAFLAEWNNHLEHASRSGRWLRGDTDEKPQGHPPV